MKIELNLQTLVKNQTHFYCCPIKVLLLMFDKMTSKNFFFWESDKKPNQICDSHWINIFKKWTSKRNISHIFVWIGGRCDVIISNRRFHFLTTLFVILWVFCDVTKRKSRTCVFWPKISLERAFQRGHYNKNFDGLSVAMVLKCLNF